MASPKLSLLPCGHFAARGEQCSICAERAQAERVAEIVAATPATAVGPDPTDATATTAVATAPAIGETEPVAGVYDLPDSIYHADPLRAYGTESLSATSHRHLIAPSTPAHYRWKMDHRPSPTAAMILGSAVHALSLETADLAIFDGASWDSKAGRQFLVDHDPDGDEAPILAKDIPAAKAMAQALRDHQIVPLGLRGGRPEQALFVQHPRLGIWLRCKVDYLTGATGDRIIVTDVKTTDCAHPAMFTRSAGKYAYDLQADAIAHQVKALGLASHVTVIFAAVESKPPYLVAVHEIDTADLRQARAVNEAAEQTFARCLETGTWPGYPAVINRITLPPWDARQREEAAYYEEDTAA